MTSIEQIHVESVQTAEESTLRAAELRSHVLLVRVERERAARSYLLHVQRQHEAWLDLHTAGR